MKNLVLNCASLYGYSKLCYSCQEIFTGEKIRRAVYPHSKRFEDIKASAAGGCHLCTILWNHEARSFIYDYEYDSPWLPGWEVFYTIFLPDDTLPLSFRFMIWTAPEQWELRFELCAIQGSSVDLYGNAGIRISGQLGSFWFPRTDIKREQNRVKLMASTDASPPMPHASILQNHGSIPVPGHMLDVVSPGANGTLPVSSMLALLEPLTIRAYVIPPRSSQAPVILPLVMSGAINGKIQFSSFRKRILIASRNSSRHRV